MVGSWFPSLSIFIEVMTQSCTASGPAPSGRLPRAEQVFSILNMRSVSPADATTRSRIRDTAITLFGRGGNSRTTIRDIAVEAQVSPALVIHHFGTKERLRQECDQHVITAIFGRTLDLDPHQTSDELAATMQRWLADADSDRATLDYLMQMLTDGSELGDRLFDLLVDRTEKMISDEVELGRMHGSSDPRMTAVLVASQGLVPLLLERHIGRALGAEGQPRQVIRRMTVPTLELYTHGLYTDETFLNAARAAFEAEHNTDTDTDTDTDTEHGNPR
jgi:AcrR family transcriptional regulator